MNNLNINPAENHLLNGRAGVLLLLLESYRVQKNAVLLQQATELGQELVLELTQNKSGHFGLYQGKMGWIYALAALHQNLPSSPFLGQAISFALDAKRFLQSRYANNSIYNGRAGTLLVLIHLYQISEDQKIGQLIDLAAQKLLFEVLIAEEGIYWDFKHDRIQGLLGFYHGASGIAFALQQFALVSDQKDLGQCLNQLALQYENHQWQKEAKNWPNHFMPIHSSSTEAQFRKRYVQEGSQALSTPNYHSIDAQHGTLSVLLSRCVLDAEVINSTDQLRAAQKLIMEKAKWPSLSDFDHLMIQIIQELAPATSAEWATVNQSSVRYIEAFLAEKNPNDHLSQAWLKLRYTGGSLQPLIPTLNTLTEVKWKSSIDASTLQESLLSRNFHRTLQVIRQLTPQAMAALSGKDFLNPVFLFQRFANLVSNILASVNLLSQKQLTDIFELEQSIFQYKKHLPSWSQIYLQRYFDYQLAEELLRLGDAYILAQTYILQAHVKLVELGWNWDYLSYGSNYIKNLTEAKEEHYVFLHPSMQYFQVNESYLDELETIFLNFEEPLSGNDLLTGIQEEMDLQDEEMPTIRSAVIRLLLQFIQKGIITKKEDVASEVVNESIKNSAQN